jgi:mono/diheme cytochrome c family protein
MQSIQKRSRLRRVWWFAKRTFIVLAALIVAAVAGLYGWSEWQLRRSWTVSADALTIPTDAASLARGKHLATNIALCNECHGEDFGGKMFFDAGPIMARIATPNLTRGRGGIGATYTDADWLRALRHGVSPAGRQLVIMPSEEFTKMPAPDLVALIAYVKSVPPVDRVHPEKYLGPMGRVLMLTEPKLLPTLLIDHAAPPPAAPSTDLVARGDELTTLAGCKSCHKADFTGGGGPPPFGANLTPVGIGTWTRDDFLRTLRTHETPDRRQLSEAMPRALGNMTDGELDAIWAYLQTVPAKGEKSPRQAAGAAVARQGARLD